MSMNCLIFWKEICLKLYFGQFKIIQSVASLVQSCSLYWIPAQVSVEHFNYSKRHYLQLSRDRGQEGLADFDRRLDPVLLVGKQQVTVSWKGSRRKGRAGVMSLDLVVNMEEALPRRLCLYIPASLCLAPPHSYPLVGQQRQQRNGAGQCSLQSSIPGNGWKEAPQWAQRRGWLRPPLAPAHFHRLSIPSVFELHVHPLLSLMKCKIWTALYLIYNIL